MARRRFAVRAQRLRIRLAHGGVDPIAFLRVRAGAGWGRTLLLTVCGIGFMCLMAGALNRDFPPGLLQDAVDLPWPLK